MTDNEARNIANAIIGDYAVGLPEDIPSPKKLQDAIVSWILPLAPYPTRSITIDEDKVLDKK